MSDPLVVSAHGRVVAATDPGTGTPVELPAVLERLGWLCTIAGELARPIMAAHGNPQDVRLFVSGKIPGGGRRARKAYKALEQLGWAAPPAAPGGLFVPSRVRRMASEHAGRTLRSSAVQLELTEAMLECWPQHVDLDQLPTKPVMVLVRNTRRHLRNHLNTHVIPLDQPLTVPLPVTEVWSPGGAREMADLSVVDGEYATLARRDSRLHITLRLPTQARPACRADWSKVQLELSGFTHLLVEGSRVSWPTFRLDVDGVVRVEIPVVQPTPVRVPLELVCRVYGYDWGVNRLLTGMLVHRDQDGPWTANRPGHFNPAGMSALYHRQRQQGQYLRGKRDRTTQLLQGLQPDSPAATKLLEAIDRAGTQNRHVSNKMTRGNRETARLAAKWAVSQALAAGAQALVVEDLRDMEPTGMDRRNRIRMSAQVRGILMDELARACAQAGLWLIVVPARGTSSFCARCGSPIRHIKAPNNRRSGWSWGVCTGPG